MLLYCDLVYVFIGRNLVVQVVEEFSFEHVKVHYYFCGLTLSLVADKGEESYVSRLYSANRYNSKVIYIWHFRVYSVVGCDRKQL